MEELIDILIVDDDADIRNILYTVLATNGGFFVRVCDSGKMALEEVLKKSPQLILLDMVMPEMDGPTTLKNLRLIPEASLIPVIFLTALSQSTKMSVYKKMGVWDVIIKPFDPRQLSKKILSIWHAHKIDA